MKTLNISISEADYRAFHIPTEQLHFTDFLEIIRREVFRQNLDKCVELAEKYGLSSMTMEEISQEVQAVRRHNRVYPS
jgi:hypothetical protein